MGHIIDVDGVGFFLCIKNGCLTAIKENRELLYVHPSDVSSIICHGTSQSFSSAFMVCCAEYNIPVIFCDKKHLPISISLPVNQHTKTFQRMMLQMETSVPTKKQIWQMIIKEKLKNQAEHVGFYGNRKIQEKIMYWCNLVKSGDTTGCEALGARLYFSAIFGQSFKRHEDDVTNILMNYIYTVLRSCIARQVNAAGLNPFFSIFHSNKENPMALIDDLIEPFRPLADRYVVLIKELYKGESCLTPDMKRQAIMITKHDVYFEGVEQELQVALKNYIYSYIAVLGKEKKKLAIPEYSYDFTL